MPTKTITIKIPAQLDYEDIVDLFAGGFRFAEYGESIEILGEDCGSVYSRLRSGSIEIIDGICVVGLDSYSHGCTMYYRSNPAKRQADPWDTSTLSAFWILDPSTSEKARAYIDNQNQDTLDQILSELDSDLSILNKFFCGDITESTTYTLEFEPESEEHWEETIPDGSVIYNYGEPSNVNPFVNSKVIDQTTELEF